MSDCTPSWLHFSASSSDGDSPRSSLARRKGKQVVSPDAVAPHPRGFMEDARRASAGLMADARRAPGGFMADARRRPPATSADIAVPRPAPSSGVLEDGWVEVRRRWRRRVRHPRPRLVLCQLTSSDAASTAWPETMLLLHVATPPAVSSVVGRDIKRGSASAPVLSGVVHLSHGSAVLLFLFVRFVRRSPPPLTVRAHLGVVARRLRTPRGRQGRNLRVGRHHCRKCAPRLHSVKMALHLHCHLRPLPRGRLETHLAVRSRRSA